MSSPLLRIIYDIIYNWVLRIKNTSYFPHEKHMDMGHNGNVIHEFEKNVFENSSTK